MKNANPVSWCRLTVVAALAAAAVLWAEGCAKREKGAGPSLPALPAAPTGVAHYAYEVVRAWPHDRGAFTQGLVWREGSLLESTGLLGESRLREVELASGRVLKEVAVGREFFAEGLAVIGAKAYQLTWQNRRGFVYDADTFRRLGEFGYEGEGWGLASDGRLLVLSDGTSRLRFLDPESFAVVRSVEVTLEGKPLARLNELEWAGGEILANVWMTDRVVRIDPASGVVRGVIDFSGLLPAMERAADTDVLNGIAYDAAGDRLFVTGKRWPWVYEVRVVGGGKG